MAVNEPFDPLRDATDALRAAPEPRWIDLSAQIKRRLREVALPGQPMLTFPDDPAPDSRVWVSTRVVIAELRRAVAEPDVALSDADLVIEDDRLSEIRLDVVCAYGTDLPAAGQRVIDTATAVVADMALIDPESGSFVDVLIADIVPGDPRYV